MFSVFALWRRGRRAGTLRDNELSDSIHGAFGLIDRTHDYLQVQRDLMGIREI